MPSDDESHNLNYFKLSFLAKIITQYLGLAWNKDEGISNLNGCSF